MKRVIRSLWLSLWAVVIGAWITVGTATAGNTYRGTLTKIGETWFLRTEPEGNARPAVFTLRTYVPKGPDDFWKGRYVQVEGDEESCTGAFECLRVINVLTEFPRGTASRR